MDIKKLLISTHQSLISSVVTGKVKGDGGH